MKCYICGTGKNPKDTKWIMLGRFQTHAKCAKKTMEKLIKNWRGEGGFLNYLTRWEKK